MPTARHVWDQLLISNLNIHSYLDNENSKLTSDRLWGVAEEYGKPVFESLVHEYRAHVAREREKAEYAFTVKRKTVERIGLPQVRNHRLELLAREERVFQERNEHKMQVYPEMLPLLLIRVEGNNHE